MKSTFFTIVYIVEWLNQVKHTCLPIYCFLVVKNSWDIFKLSEMCSALIYTVTLVLLTATWASELTSPHLFAPNTLSSLQKPWNNRIPWDEIFWILHMSNIMLSVLCLAGLFCVINSSTTYDVAHDRTPSFLWLNGMNGQRYLYSSDGGHSVFMACLLCLVPMWSWEHRRDFGSGIVQATVLESIIRNANQKTTLLLINTAKAPWGPLSLQK